LKKKKASRSLSYPPQALRIFLDFYNTFWSIQLPCSKPSLFALPQTFGEFQEAVNKVLPVIKEATVKERALTGSRTVMTGAAAANPLKRKREADPAAEQTPGKEYFFAKFLTSPDLLDLEVRPWPLSTMVT
jgi:THO complex subunit 1